MNQQREIELERRAPVSLAGLRVLDLGRFIAAPLCAQLLAQQGAEVIRIEPPEGAPDRETMPIGVPGLGGMYLQMNGNKKSVTLDHTQPDGRAVLDRLVKTADIVVANLPRRALQALQLDYDSLRSLRPDIILTTISAFDPDGADADRVGFDGTGQALSGAMALTGTGERPMRAAVSYVDYATGIAAAFATLAAVLDRMATGQGQHVRCSLMGTALTMTNPMLMEEAAGSRRRSALVNRSPIAGPSDLFRARDGWVMVQVIGDPMFARWAELIGRPDLLDDPRLATDSDRGLQGEELSALMAEWCAARSVAECLAELEARRLPACQTLTPAETLAAPWLADYAIPLAPRAGGPGVPLVTRAIRTRASESAATRPAPDLGADTDAVLGALGLTPADIAGLRRARVI